MLKTIIKRYYPIFCFTKHKAQTFILIVASVLVGLLDGLGLVNVFTINRTFADPKLFYLRKVMVIFLFY